MVTDKSFSFYFIFYFNVYCTQIKAVYPFFFPSSPNVHGFRPLIMGMVIRGKGLKRNQIACPPCGFRVLVMSGAVTSLPNFPLSPRNNRLIVPLNPPVKSDRGLSVATADPLLFRFLWAKEQWKRPAMSKGTAAGTAILPSFGPHKSCSKSVFCFVKHGEFMPCFSPRLSSLVPVQFDLLF